MKLHIPLLALTALCFSATSNAATIAFAGAINNDAGSEITQWKTSTTAKTLDPDGDNIYGTAGSLFYRVGTYGTAATFGGLASGNTETGPHSGYVSVDHPNGGATNTQVRTTTNGGVAGVNYDMASFVMTASAPQNVRVGIATDGLNGAQYSPASIGLRQVGGAASAEHTLTAVNSTIDMIFFDVYNVQTGDQFMVFGDTGTGDFATHSFVSLDAIPEPSSATLIAILGIFGFALRRRR